VNYYITIYPENKRVSSTAQLFVGRRVSIRVYIEWKERGGGKFGEMDSFGGVVYYHLTLKNQIRTRISTILHCDAISLGIPSCLIYSSYFIILLWNSSGAVLSA